MEQTLIRKWPVEWSKVYFASLFNRICILDCFPLFPFKAVKQENVACQSQFGWGSQLWLEHRGEANEAPAEQLCIFNRAPAPAALISCLVKAGCSSLLQHLLHKSKKHSKILLKPSPFWTWVEGQETHAAPFWALLGALIVLCSPDRWNFCGFPSNPLACLVGNFSVFSHQLVKCFYFYWESALYVGSTALQLQWSIPLSQHSLVTLRGGPTRSSWGVTCHSVWATAHLFLQSSFYCLKETVLNVPQWFFSLMYFPWHCNCAGTWVVLF